MAGGKVIQADDALAQLEQGFQQVAADKTCYAGDKPGARLGKQTRLQLKVGGHFNSLLMVDCIKLT